jgi:endonuclease YncB( thermonuclease family)
MAPSFCQEIYVGRLFINRELVRRGLAWHYQEYSDDKRLADDENHARLKKLGLWGGSHKLIAPWE